MGSAGCSRPECSATAGPVRETPTLCDPSTPGTRPNLGRSQGRDGRACLHSTVTPV
ncbi:MAG: hypothetical protein JWN81_644 [Solirubrobacterales bacterium]|nr:hypothetical protein [Solirubrobacterales bacterium]